MKKITSYYRTKGLIEQYDLDEDGTPKKRGDGAVANGGGAKGGEDVSHKTPQQPSKKDLKGNPSIAHHPANSAPPQDAAATDAGPKFTQLSNGPGALSGMSTPPSLAHLSAIPQQQTWLDRLVDALLGDDRTSRYALICQKCLSHNGLARQDEFDYIRTHLLLNCYVPYAEISLMRCRIYLSTLPSFKSTKKDGDGSICCIVGGRPLHCKWEESLQ